MANNLDSNKNEYGWQLQYYSNSKTMWISIKIGLFLTEIDHNTIKINQVSITIVDLYVVFN